MGAVPVFYVPLHGEIGSAGSLGATIVSRLGDTQILLERLSEIKTQSFSAGRADVLKVVDMPSGERRAICSTDAVINLMQVLEDGIQPVGELLNSLRALFGYFYPTENLEYGTLLNYYRQREWRIVANAILEGVEMTGFLNADEAEEISAIDPEFFERASEYPTGKKKTIEQTKRLMSFKGRHIIETCRRLIVPEEHIERAKVSLNSHGLSLQVVSLSSI